MSLRGIRSLARETGRDRDRRRGLGQLFAQSADLLGRHVRPLGHALRGVGGQEIGQLLGSAASPDHHGGDGQGDQPFRPRPGRHPLVGLEAREREARTDKGQLRLTAVVDVAGLGQPSGLLHRRVPRSEEVGSETDDAIGAAEIVGRNLGSSERGIVRGSRRLLAERFPADVLRAGRGGPHR